MIHAGDCLLEVAQGAVDLAEFPVRRPLPLGGTAAAPIRPTSSALHRLVGRHQSLLVANLQHIQQLAGKHRETPGTPGKLHQKPGRPTG